ncbi:MAG: hypothetical protein GC191_19640 [Azospirillum sp.]|nr:hypothetical protein [Azospirillum sp.]
MSRIRGICCLLAVALLWRSSAFAEPLRLRQTDPGHMGSRDLLPVIPPPDQPLTRYADPGREIYRFPDGLDRIASPDRTLSTLCRRGAFTQEFDGQLFASTPDRRYGLGLPGNHGNLHDPQGRARPDTAYFFARSGTSACSVTVASLARLQQYLVSTQP